MYQLSIFLVMDAVKLLRAERQRRREAASVSPKSDTKDKGDVDSAPKLAEESPLAKHVRWLSSGPFLPFTSATPLDLSKYRVGSIDSVYYVPDFISAEYGSALVQSSSSSLLLDKWVSLRGRQLQNWGGIPPQSYDAIPRWLQQVPPPHCRRDPPHCAAQARSWATNSCFNCVLS